MRYKKDDVNNSAKVFARMTAIINPIAAAHFFIPISRGVFEHLWAAGSKDKGLFGLVSTYSGTIKTNCKGMLYLHYLVWVCIAFYISQLCNQM